jgi:hypothetical protein
MEQPSETKSRIKQLVEGIAKRRVVVRGGKRKTLFRCKPGEKKVGRQCRRMPSSQLTKLKRRARLAARKSRTKRMRAQRRRKLSLRRRRNIPKTPR